MQPRPIAETIGPPRPSFRCFILVEIRLSVLSRPRNRQATALQSFSIPQCEDGEIQASTHATFVVENSLQGAAHRFYRRAPDDRDDEDARGSGESVRCVETMNDAGTLLSADSRQSRAVVEERIDESVFAMTSTRMNDKPRRLVDDDEIVVFEEYLNRDRLREHLDLFQRRLDQLNLVAASDNLAWPAG